MEQYKHLVNKIAEWGHTRDTRSGEVLSKSVEHMEFWLPAGFPAITIKKLMFKTMVGELLWFLSGKTDLDSLRAYSNKPEGAWTIWTPDVERWHAAKERSVPKNDAGKLYGYQWRNYAGQIDQIANLIKVLKEDPYGRYHIVTAWNPLERANDEMALPACHRDFQCYVNNDNTLDLHFTMRSNDIFLGNPFNVASYALLNHILAQLCGLTAGKLSCTIIDAHIYTAHIPKMQEIMRNPIFKAPTLVMPEFNTLDELLELTAEDFKLEGYECFQGDASAPLLVG